MAASNTALDWKWSSQHVQNDIQNGEFVSAETTLILSGPSRLDMVGGGDDQLLGIAAPGSVSAGQSVDLFPMGLIQSAQIGQNRTVARFFEIGAKRSYFIPQRIITNWGLNRVLFFGASLLRILYAIAPEAILETAGGTPFLASDGTTLSIDPAHKYAELFQFFGAQNVDGETDPDDFLDAGAPGEAIQNEQSETGESSGLNVSTNRDFWTNLNSPIFNVPFGMAFVFKDSKNRPYGSFYLEENFVENHTITVTSQDVVIAEGVNGVTDLIKPVKLLNALPNAAGTLAA